MVAEEVTVDSFLNMVNPALQKTFSKEGIDLVCFLVFCFLLLFLMSEKLLEDTSYKNNNTNDSENKIK